jgi:hypothetical protein
MRIVFHLCLLAACAMSSGIALATSHGHRPNAAAVRSRSLSDDAAKSPVKPAEPTGATPSSSAGGGKGGDAAAPIDTSITVNQGHPRVTGKDSAAKKLNIAFGAPPAKPHLEQPVYPFAAHVVARRNAVGAAVHVPRATVNHAGAATVAFAPAAHPGAAPAAPALPDAGATVAPAPKTPAATSAEHAAAALKAAIANGPSITGTGIKRPEAATAAVGGSKKVVAGVVSGNSFRPRHP